MTKSKKPIKKSVKSKDKRRKSIIQRLDEKDWKYVGICLLLTLIAFISVIGDQFVNWDDDYNIANNNNTAMLSWHNIVKMFSEHVIGNYNPLPILTFTIERSIVGLDPTLYHVNNLILHLVCVF